MASPFRLFAAACFSVGACSLTTSLDGLTGGDGSKADGGGDDASTIDSAPASDAAIDAGNSTDASSTSSPCDGGHTFCADFDESSNVPAYDNLEDPEHDLSIDTLVSRSAPNSLQALLPVNGDFAGITKNLVAGTHAHVAFDFMLEGSSGDTILLWLYSPYGNGFSDHSFYIETYVYAMQFTESVSPDDGGSNNYLGSPLGNGVTNGVWSHVDFTVDGTTGQVATILDGVENSNSMLEPFPAGGFTLLFGEQPNGDSASVKAHFDNLVVDIH